ncbi:MAG: phosphodiester glycosidase family protein [Desulfotomaculum sp.]|nr:phosphodiester glycosidase family protein [Desulfotomaculum sp.]
MRLINIFFIFLIAPLIGVAVAFADFDQRVQVLALPLVEIDQPVKIAENNLIDLQKNIDYIYQTIVEQEKIFQEQQQILHQLAQKTEEQARLSDHVYEERILAMLGPPIRTHRSKRVEVKVFKLDELGYRGFIAKVKLFDPTAFKVVLAQDKLGESETPGQAVARTGAILGINGGGFYNFIQDGREYTLPIANTVIDGKLINGFHYPTGPNEDVFLAGIRRDGTLFGGVFYNEPDLMAAKPWQGVSFVPILIQGGKPVTLPEKWQRTKEPRTIIGEYANGDFILIVVDGRQADWSSGVTLERLQIKLIELGVKEGYNLDGGGSSVFIFNGEVLNRPSDGKQRAMATNIMIMP